VHAVIVNAVISGEQSMVECSVHVDDEHFKLCRTPGSGGVHMAY